MVDPVTIATIAGLIGISAKDLIKAYRKFLNTKKSEEREERLVNRIENNKKIISNGFHIKALENLYPESSLNEFGIKRYKVNTGDRVIHTTVAGFDDYIEKEIALTENSEDHKMIENAKIILDLEKEKTAKILADIHERGLKIWDAPLYCINHFEISDEKIKVKFNIEYFMRYRLTYGALWDELLQGIYDSKYDIEKLTNNKSKFLYLREKYLPGAENIASYSKRMCVGGIQATVAIQRPDPWDDFVIPIQRRSSRLSEGQNLFTTIPSAFHQPMISISDEMKFSSTFYRELYEELFGGEEATSRVRRLCHEWYFKESEPLEWLQKHKGDYRLLLTGAGFELTSGNYGISILLIIRNTEFWKKFSHKIKANWETSEDISPLLSTKDKKSINNLLGKPEWTGGGLCSLCRALIYIKRTEPTKINVDISRMQ